LNARQSPSASSIPHTRISHGVPLGSSHSAPGVATHAPATHASHTPHTEHSSLVDPSLDDDDDDVDDVDVDIPSVPDTAPVLVDPPAPSPVLDAAGAPDVGDEPELAISVVPGSPADPAVGGSNAGFAVQPAAITSTPLIIKIKEPRSSMSAILPDRPRDRMSW
jgi:hypothetical protein